MRNEQIQMKYDEYYYGAEFMAWAKTRLDRARRPYSIGLCRSGPELFVRLPWLCLAGKNNEGCSYFIGRHIMDRKKCWRKQMARLLWQCRALRGERERADSIR